ncbi:Putative membrane protein [Lentibacillus persicus]|uniref:Putative membrane protein n=1 Tax=Lentibacillus persicus TaxID=640948 RepID=A0A1I1WG89_9BACI|nr:YuiB family protein [Lentibacillus persicus]SFD94157.1 Putative membrane protein [Lentibacillus persicus]
MIQFVVSVLLFFVIFFGLAFILNMLLRSTWLMAAIYPIIVLMIVDDISTADYFTGPGEAFSAAFSRLTEITVADISILGAGFAGTIVSGFVIKYLRKSGYQMF